MCERLHTDFVMDNDDFHDFFEEFITFTRRIFLKNQEDYENDIFDEKQEYDDDDDDDDDDDIFDENVNIRNVEVFNGDNYDNEDDAINDFINQVIGSSESESESESESGSDSESD